MICTMDFMLARMIPWTDPAGSRLGSDTRTLTFQDVNHDGKLDMIVNIQDTSLVFFNENGTFVPAPSGQNGGS